VVDRMHITQQQEQFSNAYLRAVATVAGNTEIPSNFSSEISINVDSLPKLKEAKEKLKSKKVVTYFQEREKRRKRKLSPLFQESSKTESLDKVEGKVIKLEWGEEDKKGRVTIITSNQQNTEESEVVIELNRVDYKKAFQANLDQTPIVCTGNLIEEKNQLIMVDVRTFAIESKIANINLSK